MSKKDLYHDGKCVGYVSDSSTGSDINPKDLAGRLKAPITLLPAIGILEGSEVMRHGAEKYGAYNWRTKKVQALVYADAMIRHILEWVEGLDKDRDSGRHPLGHVIASCSIVLDAAKYGQLIDNRPLTIMLKNREQEATHSNTLLEDAVNEDRKDLEKTAEAIRQHNRSGNESSSWIAEDLDAITKVILGKK